MKNRIPQTLVRSGRYDGLLEDALKRFRERLEPVRSGLGNMVKYAIFKPGANPYLLMVSQQKDRLVSPSGYNVILTITSYDEEQRRALSEQFERETEINLNVKLPEVLIRQFQRINLIFKIFEETPIEAMDVLRRS